MKTKLICGLAAAVLLLAAGTASAEVLFSYDFEGLDPGNIVTQDGWTASFYSTYRNAYVGNGAGGNTSQVWMGNPETVSSGFITSGSERMHATPLKFHDQALVEFSFLAYAGKGPGAWDQENVAVGMMWNGKDEYRENLVGVYYSGSGASNTPKAWFRGGTQTIMWGDTLESNVWYEIKAVIDLSALCANGTTYGQLTYQYRKVGDLNFVTDGTLVNKDMNLTSDMSGKFQSNGILAYFQGAISFVQKTHIDNISISQEPIPEPSTLALLVCGLFGLLAYAWRKRK